MHVNDRFHDNVAHLLFSYNLYGHGLKRGTSEGTLFTECSDGSGSGVLED